MNSLFVFYPVSYICMDLPFKEIQQVTLNVCDK